ncbi:sirohydrochlorin cobaltochelatase [Porphyromonas macacae]|uniref:sirohydrochlorin cobaltochelatase n=1 Tax=Porphyromonas macacae TaxID=28115 RepID=UPI0024AD19FD|nr:sirohydrochlorin cobaltochelatase [Porphyromonas macacae]
MKKLIYLLLALTVTAFFTACKSDDEPKDSQNELTKIDKKNDTALLLVTFGSTYEAPHATFKAMVSKFKAKYPNTDVYLSFTSTTTITRWGAKTKEYFATPDKWFKAINKAGYKNVYVQSLHVIPGEEFIMLRDYYIKNFKKDMAALAEAGKPHTEKLYFGMPLLYEKEDIEAVGEALYNIYKKDVEAGTGVAFMGHGNPEDSYSYANTKYHEVENYLKNKNKNFFVATVDALDMLAGNYLIPNIKKQLPAGSSIKLAPMMSIAGDHANNDMAGDKDDKAKPEEQSWRIQLSELGYKVPVENCVLKGLADYDAILSVWMKHLDKAIKEAENILEFE